MRMRGRRTNIEATMKQQIKWERGKSLKTRRWSFRHEYASSSSTSDLTITDDHPTRRPLVFATFWSPHFWKKLPTLNACLCPLSSSSSQASFSTDCCFVGRSTNRRRLVNLQTTAVQTRPTRRQQRLPIYFTHPPPTWNPSAVMHTP